MHLLKVDADTQIALIKSIDCIKEWHVIVGYQRGRGTKT